MGRCGRQRGGWPGPSGQSGQSVLGLARPKWPECYTTARSFSGMNSGKGLIILIYYWYILVYIYGQERSAAWGLARPKWPDVGAGPAQVARVLHDCAVNFGSEFRKCTHQ